MSWWVYKCNSRQGYHQVVSGDWDEFFSDGNSVRQWGTTANVPELARLQPGDRIVAYQTDRNELVGLAEVARRKGGEVYLRPLQTIRVKVKPIKQSVPRVAEIPAFKPGRIATIYQISAADVRVLMRATGQRISLPTEELADGASEEHFVEGERRASDSSCRNAALRVAAKKKWGVQCYCCGFAFEDFYGEVAAHCAIVHHLDQFSSKDVKPRRSTVNDVRVVCANCHYVIHLTNPAMQIDDLKGIIEARWRPWTRRGVDRKR